MTKLLSAIVLILFVAACGTRTVYVPVPSVKTEYRDVLLRDSVYRHDSVWVRMANDTVWMEKYKTIYKNRILHDSVLVTDSIRVPYPVVQVDERRVYPLWLIIPAMLGCVTVGWGVFRVISRWR